MNVRYWRSLDSLAARSSKFTVVALWFATSCRFDSRPLLPEELLLMSR
jgi:hypothetical protein